jgi:hypothetical protein
MTLYSFDISLYIGGILSSLSKTSAIQTHGTTLRMYHLWLPVPLGIAVVKKALEDT